MNRSVRHLILLVIRQHRLSRKISSSVPYRSHRQQTNTEPAFTASLRPADSERKLTLGDKSERNNHANQLNENNDAYWQSRGHDERPDDWEERSDEDQEIPRRHPVADVIESIID